MKKTYSSFQETQQFNRLFLDYMNQVPELSSFYGSYPTLENIQAVSQNYSSIQRAVLVQELTQQYANCSTSELTRYNIDALAHENTFTVTTGHQLNLATGPLFFIFKIITTLNLAKELAANYPEQHFVPIFWMATEDHDFEEINHFSLFGKKYEWNSEQKGAVGRFSTEGIQRIFDQLPEIPDVLRKAYEQPTLSLATRYLVNELFKDKGLVILDADSSELKKHASPIFEQELLEQPSEKHLLTTSEKLTQLGYKAQVHPRSINLFYLTDGIRERIVFENGLYRVNNTALTFNTEEIKEELRLHPERFSPNVVLRPVYQQHLLPNLAYVGGPGELAYWLQLKTTFNYFNVPFPVLVPRNCGMLLSSTMQKKLEKLQLSVQDLFKPFQTLKHDFLATVTEQELTLTEEVAAMQSIFARIAAKAKEVDGSLEKAMEAEWSRMEKQCTGIEKRLKKAEERKHETTIKQLEGIKEKLFPGGTLQERHDSIFSFLMNHPTLLNELSEHLSPLSFQFVTFNL